MKTFEEFIIPLQEILKVAPGITSMGIPLVSTSTHAHLLYECYKMACEDMKAVNK